jgi:nucleotide-binding universal stress UspA family protein
MLYKSLFSAAFIALAIPAAAADSLTGTYLESRTCQVYTGPCFANAETALAGREAMMAWNIESGKKDSVDLAGLSVVVVVRGNDTLGYKGVEDPQQLKSAIIVDAKATARQREALIAFAKEHAGRAGKEVVRVDSAPISMSLDSVELRGELKAGDVVKLTTRKARPGDCICSNEVQFYPPLAQIERFAAGVSIEAEYKGTGLGATWSTPESRSAYMGEFSYPAQRAELAGSE